MQNYKITLPDENVSMQVQEKAFRLGYCWDLGEHNAVQHIYHLFLYSDTFMTKITYEDKEYFNQHSNSEISWQNFLKLPEFDVNNCKIRLSGKDLVSLSSRLIQLGIKGYSNRNASVQVNNPVRDLWGPTLTIVEHPNAYHPGFMFIRNGQSIMVGTELYFNSLPEKEVTVEQIMQLQTNKITQIEEKIMSEVTLKCISEPKTAKNISVDRHYTGLLINSDDTQVDSWNDASHFLCTNNKGIEAKYKLSLFERIVPPAPAKLTMDELISKIEIGETNVIVEYNGSEIEVLDFGYKYCLEISHSGCSCGIKSLDGLSDLHSSICLTSYSDVEMIIDDFDRILFIKCLFKKIIIDTIDSLSAAMALCSVVEDEVQVCQIMDEICEDRNGWSTDCLRNPNSGNNIKAWLIPVNN